ncbi:MAG: hypothetical protein H7A25_10905 [Leptospiraceae bacterium]|nr:hypothetical protein [Leptospiraceae bacterium]MCP5500404.1 hypothetical protein [Leptospiraceae bacterium]
MTHENTYYFCMESGNSVLCLTVGRLSGKKRKVFLKKEMEYVIRPLNNRVKKRKIRHCIFKDLSYSHSKKEPLARVFFLDTGKIGLLKLSLLDYPAPAEQTLSRLKG